MIGTPNKFFVVVVIFAFSVVYYLLFIRNNENSKEEVAYFSGFKIGNPNTLLQLKGGKYDFNEIFSLEPIENPPSVLSSRNVDEDANEFKQARKELLGHNKNLDWDSKKPKSDDVVVTKENLESLES